MCVPTKCNRLQQTPCLCVFNVCACVCGCVRACVCTCYSVLLEKLTVQQSRIIDGWFTFFFHLYVCVICMFLFWVRLDSCSNCSTVVCEKLMNLQHMPPLWCLHCRQLVTDFDLWLFGTREKYGLAVSPVLTEIQMLINAYCNIFLCVF